jgi:hypothetical protein
MEIASEAATISPASMKIGDFGIAFSDLAGFAKENGCSTPRNRAVFYAVRIEHAGCTACSGKRRGL